MNWIMNHNPENIQYTAHLSYFETVLMVAEVNGQFRATIETRQTFDCGTYENLTIAKLASVKKAIELMDHQVAELLDSINEING